MSGPYDSYNQYSQQGGHQQPYGQGPQYGGYDQQQQPYGQQPGYPQQGYEAQQNFGPPARQDSYGPPQAGGFQHGQQGGQFGQYDASNPQGHAGYYGTGYQDANRDGYAQPHQGQPGQQPYDQQQPYQGEQPQFSPQSSDPNGPNYDPNAPPMPEGERGLLGAAGGAFAGHFLGKSANHGFLGTIGGAIMGSVLEDKFKDKKHHGKHHNGGGSSWGGGKW